eukprot:TRINITY_DN75365_c0_g1_i1.p1 TRINITY_DN75365_c0_g1~~TRINITY_DN75365_c0_g1_i1.p1  ORF type:complete len:329 (-),score=58.03 TRINITY_DN75365_c0_g1_i1:31-1017(-)
MDAAPAAASDVGSPVLMPRAVELRRFLVDIIESKDRLAELCAELEKRFDMGNKVDSDGTCYLWLEEVQALVEDLCAQSSLGSPPAAKIASAFSQADKTHNNMLSSAELRPFVKQVLRSLCLQLDHTADETASVVDNLPALISDANVEAATQLQRWFEKDSLNGAVLVEMAPSNLGRERTPAAVGWASRSGHQFVWLRLRLWRDGSCQLAHFDGRKSACGGGSKGRVIIDSTWDLLDGTFSIVEGSIVASYMVHIKATTKTWIGTGGQGKESTPWESDDLPPGGHAWRRLLLTDLRLCEIQLVSQGCGFCPHELHDGMSRFNFSHQTCF